MTRVLLITALLALLTPSVAHAIPAFARRYGVPCATCHTAIPRRNEFGDAFRKAGYRWPGLVDENAGVAPIEMRGVSAGRTLLPAQVPVALSTSLGATYTDDPNVEDSVALGRPTINVLFGASLGPHISAFGITTTEGQLEELVLQLARPWGRPELNLRLGLIEQTTTLFKSNEALIGRFEIGSSALHGLAISKARMGAEANGTLFSRLFWAAGVVQDAGPESPYDFYYHLSVKVGGMDFLGDEPDVDLEDEKVIQDLTLTLAQWGYHGEVETTAGVKVSSIRRYGLETRIGFRDVSLLAGAMVGNDRDLVTYVDDLSLTGFAELSYPIFSWLIPMYLYQYQDAESFLIERQKHDFGFVILPLENVRVRAKVSLTDDDTSNEEAELQIFLAL